MDQEDVRKMMLLQLQEQMRIERTNIEGLKHQLMEKELRMDVLLHQEDYLIKVRWTTHVRTTGTRSSGTKT